MSTILDFGAKSYAKKRTALVLLHAYFEYCNRVTFNIAKEEQPVASFSGNPIINR